MIMTIRLQWQFNSFTLPTPAAFNRFDDQLRNTYNVYVIVQIQFCLCDFPRDHESTFPRDLHEGRRCEERKIKRVHREHQDDNYSNNNDLSAVGALISRSRFPAVLSRSLDPNLPPVSGRSKAETNNGGARGDEVASASSTSSIGAAVAARSQRRIIPRLARGGRHHPVP